MEVALEGEKNAEMSISKQGKSVPDPVLLLYCADRSVSCFHSTILFILSLEVHQS